MTHLSGKMGQMMVVKMSKTAVLRLVKSDAPTRVNGTNPPTRLTNKERRPREWLTEVEVKAIAKAARKHDCCGTRDAAMIMCAFRHGLRVSELVNLRWDQVSLDEGLLSVHRLKGSNDSTHPIPGDELRELRRLQRSQAPGTRYVFTQANGAPITAAAFRKMLARTGAAMNFAFPLHPHMLR